MGWLDRLLGRDRGRRTEPDREAAEARRDVREEEESAAPAVEPEAEREENVLREPRVPPGTD